VAAGIAFEPGLPQRGKARPFLRASRGKAALRGASRGGSPDLLRGPAHAARRFPGNACVRGRDFRAGA